MAVFFERDCTKYNCISVLFKIGLVSQRKPLQFYFSQGILYSSRISSQRGYVLHIFCINEHEGSFGHVNN